ncbi:MAG: nucleoside triphosphate pyrophosphatase [Myxococcota bacterium]
MQTLLLASQSPWRKAMLQAAGIPVEGIAPGVDERAVQRSLGNVGPEQVAMALARAKADAVAAEHQGRTLLAADQVLWDGQEVIGKPSDPQDHMRRLCAMRGRTHDLVTAWCLRLPDLSERVGIARTSLAVRSDLSDSEIARYVESGEGSGCAGGYAVEGHGVWLFDRIDGSWHNIIGLPLLDILTALRSAGWRYGTVKP